MAMPASTLRLPSYASCQRSLCFDSFRYHCLFTSCHQLFPVLTCLVEPLSLVHKRNEFLVFGSTCYLRKFKSEKGDKQCRCSGCKQCELCMGQSKFLASTLWCRVEEFFNSHFSYKHWKISEDIIGNIFGEQHLPALMGRRHFFSLALVYLASLLTVYAPSALAVSKREQKMGLYDEKRLLEQNKRIQNLNGVPPDFPNFVREGFDVKVVTSDNYVRCDSGLIYWDMKEGEGDYPKSGQQVVFHYTGYNESGRRIDSSYQQGRPAKTRIGINGLVPGIEEGIRTMKPGGKRRIIVPPELGPPVGPSTFFSAKQFEVFDVELLNVQDCTRELLDFTLILFVIKLPQGFFSDIRMLVLKATDYVLVLFLWHMLYDFS